MFNAHHLAPRFGGFAVWALTAGLAVLFAVQIVQVGRASTAPQVPIASVHVPAPDSQALAQLMGAAPVQPAAASNAAPPTGQDWTGVQLLGIVHAPRNGGHAVLAWPELGARTARAGQVLPNGWTLHSMEPHAITARRGRSDEGQQHRLELPQPAQP